jgi:1-acyl-sn-glycerol-3-phosphate acyltransferase
MDKVHYLLYKLAAFIIRLVLRINGGVEIIGKDNIPAEGGALVAANHISYLDPPLIGAFLPRIATFMARKGLFEMPIISWLIKGSAYPVDRERTRPSTIKETVRRLKNGELIVMFPEGRRSETGELMEAKRGIGMVANLSKAPVVPALIVGSDKALPVDAKWLKRAKISVVFGKPIDHASLVNKEGNSSHVLNEEISNKIIAAIRELKNNYEE